MINTIAEVYHVDPVRAMEVWVSHPDLINACLEARSAEDVYRKQEDDPRGMSPNEVDWLSDLSDRAYKYLEASGTIEIRRAERAARMKAMEEFEGTPY